MLRPVEQNQLFGRALLNSPQNSPNKPLETKLDRES